MKIDAQRAELTANFGAEIKRRRTTWGISQARLGQMAGTTQSVIAHLEAGRGNPTLDLLLRLTAALPGTRLELMIRSHYPIER